MLKFENFTRGNYELGAQVSAVALTKGASALVFFGTAIQNVLFTTFMPSRILCFALDAVNPYSYALAVVIKIVTALLS